MLQCPFEWRQAPVHIDKWIVALETLTNALSGGGYGFPCEIKIEYIVFLQARQHHAGTMAQRCFMFDQSAIHPAIEFRQWYVRKAGPVETEVVIKTEVNEYAGVPAKVFG